MTGQSAWTAAHNGGDVRGRHRSVDYALRRAGDVEAPQASTSDVGEESPATTDKDSRPPRTNKRSPVADYLIGHERMRPRPTKWTV